MHTVEITLEQVLLARDRRVQRQQALPSPPLVRGNQKGIPASEKEYPLCLAVAQSAALIRAAPTGAAFPFFEGTKKEPSNGRLSFLLD